MPDFRRLWLVGLAISVARWLEMLVIGIVVFQETGSAFLVAAMTLLRLAPLGLFGALAGVLAVQGATVAALAALSFAGSLAVWHVAVAAFVGGLGWAADNPVRRMMVGEAVGPARMSAAMSLDVMANNASRVAGPVLGGTLLAVLGPGVAFGLAALAYLVAIGLAARVRSGAVATPARGTGLLRELRESFALAGQLPQLRAVLVVTVVYNLFAWPCASMIPVIGKASLDLGPEGVGVLASMDGLGALAGAALVGLLARADRHAAIYLAGTILYMLGMIGFALSGSPVLAGLSLLMAGIGGAGFGTMQATLTYLSAPPELRSRALGVLSTAIGTGLLGFLQLGLLAEWLGASTATALVGTQGLVVLAATWRLWRPLFQAS